MNIYVSYIVESYKDSIIDHLEYAGTEAFLLHIVQYWCLCAVNKDNWCLPMVVYCPGMIYKYYYHPGFL